MTPRGHRRPGPRCDRTPDHRRAAHDGDPRILIVVDAGYDVPRLAFVLADLPVDVLGRLRSDRVMRLTRATTADRAPSGGPAATAPNCLSPTPTTWPHPSVVTTTDTSRYGTATATAWDRVHPRLTHRTCWLDHTGPLPIIEGTLIRLQVEHLRGDRHPKPVWLWISTVEATRSRYRPRLAGLPTPVRPRTHLPAPQADPGLDPARPARSRRRGPLDLADHLRPHPTTPRPPPDRRPTPPVGETRPSRAAHPGSGPPRI